jgi:rhodanese-related sulfurtransferase
LGRLLIYDAEASSWRSLRIRPVPGRPLVRELPAAGPAAGVAGPDSAAGAGAGVEVSTDELAGLLTARDRGDVDFVLLDVREPDEHAAARIPGGLLVPLARLRSGPRPAEPGRAVVVYCAAGPRAARANELLRAEGFTDVRRLAGGMLAWIQSGVDETV